MPEPAQPRRASRRTKALNAASFFVLLFAVSLYFSTAADAWVFLAPAVLFIGAVLSGRRDRARERRA